MRRVSGVVISIWAVFDLAAGFCSGTMLYAARRVELSGAKTAPPCRVCVLKLAPGIVYGELVALCCAITRREEVSKRRGPERKRLASGETASIEDTPATVRAASTV